MVVIDRPAPVPIATTTIVRHVLKPVAAAADQAVLADKQGVVAIGPVASGDVISAGPSPITKSNRPTEALI